MSGVSTAGAARQWSQSGCMTPLAPLPVKPIVVSPPSRAAFNAAITFGERPEVEIAMKTSPGLSQSAHLPFEGALEAVVVADRGQNRTVGGQRDRRQRIAVKIQPRQEFAGDMLSIRGAAAIAGNQ